MKAYLRNGADNIEVPTIEIDGMLFREGTYDKSVWKAVPSDYRFLDVQGKNVLDIGANIGCFTVWALRGGASHVTSVEPDKNNFDLLKWNSGPRDNIRLLNNAVVGPNSPSTIKLYYPKWKKNAGMYSTQIENEHFSEVQTVNFYDLLEDIDVLKVDCEGAEYQFLDGTKLPERIKQVAIELHMSQEGWADKAEELVESFADWKMKRKPTIRGSKAATLACWHR